MTLACKLHSMKTSWNNNIKEKKWIKCKCVVIPKASALQSLYEFCHGMKNLYNVKLCYRNNNYVCYTILYYLDGYIPFAIF